MSTNQQSPLPTLDTSGKVYCPVVGCTNKIGESCDAKPRCLNLAAPQKGTDDD